jgi:integrase
MGAWATFWATSAESAYGCNPKLDFLDCLKAVAGRAKLDKDNFWLHKFRATFATRCLWGNVDLRTVKQALDREDVRGYLKPTLAKNGLTWRGLYAGRRGAGTVLTELTGDALAAQQILRHKNLAVTTAAYVKAIPTAGLNGMKLLEAAAGKK